MRKKKPKIGRPRLALPPEQRHAIRSFIVKELVAAGYRPTEIADALGLTLKKLYSWSRGSTGGLVDPANAPSLLAEDDLLKIATLAHELGGREVDFAEATRKLGIKVSVAYLRPRLRAMGLWTTRQRGRPRKDEPET